MKAVILANSFRDGGRCIGGIVLSESGSPVLENNRARWIRPVIDESHHEIPNDLAANLSLLDIVEFKALKDIPVNHHTENVLIDKHSLKRSGKAGLSVLDALTDNTHFKTIFGNKGKAVSEEAIAGLKYSLSLIKPDSVEITERTYDDSIFPQIRMTLRYHDINYDLPVTDPVFLYNFKRNHNLLNNIKKFYLTLSLAAPHEHWYYKLVAGVIY